MNPVPAFRGFPNLTKSNRQFTALDVGVETDLRIKAAGLTMRDAAEHEAGPASMELTACVIPAQL